MMICFVLFKHATACARSLARLKTGSNKDARMPMIAITTSSSIKVKADFDDCALPAMISRFILFFASPGRLVGFRRLNALPAALNVLTLLN